MARPRLSLDDTKRGEIYHEFVQYALETNTIPNPHTFYHNVLKPKGYDIEWSTFRDHWKELQLDGLIQIDQATGAVIIVEAEVVKRDENLKNRD